MLRARRNFKNINEDFNNQNLSQYVANFGKLEDNSKHIRNMMVQQSNIVNSLTEEILDLLKLYPKLWKLYVTEIGLIV